MDYAKAMRCATLAGEIYHDFSTIKFSEFGGSEPDLIQDRATDTQCAMLPDASANALYIVFRGTEKSEDWKTNVNFSRELFEVRPAEPDAEGPSATRDIMPVIDPDLPSTAPRAKMHEGFVTAYMAVQRRIHNYLRSNRPKDVFVTGHSLGGALATLCAIDLQLTYEGAYALEIYTFGSPRVGNADFSTLFNEHLPNHYRFINGVDLIPSLPSYWQGYRHVDQQQRIGHRFTWNFFSARVTDHYMRSYIATLQQLATE